MEGLNFFHQRRAINGQRVQLAVQNGLALRLSDVLKYAGIKENAIYVAYEGEDRHLSGDPLKKPISRGVPLYKALEDESLLVWDMNGEPLPLIHGAPLENDLLRLASVSKWKMAF